MRSHEASTSDRGEGMSRDRKLDEQVLESCDHGWIPCVSILVRQLIYVLRRTAAYYGMDRESTEKNGAISAWESA